MDDTLAADFYGVVALMSNSWHHHTYTVQDLGRLVVPPLTLGQYIHIPKHTFISYGFLTEEAEEGYLDGSRKIEPLDWNAGDRGWVIDVINFGGRRHLFQVFRQLKRRHPDRLVQWRRNYRNGERRHGALVIN